MQFNPKIRNFKLKKLEKLDFENASEASQNIRNSTFVNVISSVDERINDGEGMLSNDHVHKRKALHQTSLIISNKARGSNTEQEFTERMDPRDKIINVPFHFSVQIPPADTIDREYFLTSKFFASISERVEDYLVRVLELVVSVSFNQLMDKKLKENQCKDYASKNILLNVHSICRQTFKSLKEHSLINGIEKEVELALAKLADHTLANAVTNLAPYYPQAPPTGGTPRIREALLAIDRNYNSELDFLSTQNLKLQRSASGDYTEYIMRVINQAILVTGEVQDDSSQLTMFEKFKEFMENIIWMAKDESYAKVMNNFIEAPKKKANPKKDLNADGTQSLIKRQESVKQDFRKRKELIKTFFKEDTVANARQALYIEGQKAPNFSQESKQKQIQIMKLNHELQLGQKLPSGLQTFSKNDLKDRNFTAKHSSVLRVITKWAQNLEAVFQNAEKFVLNRNYPFTTLSGKSVYPKSDLKQQIFNQINALREKKSRIHQELVARNKLFQADFLTKNVGDIDNVTRFIKRYTQTRIVASKMNTLIIKFMEEYVSELINLLVEAGKFGEKGEDKQGKGQADYINLVSFRIGDLMRARMNVNEASFIRVLHTLYLLDQSQSKESPFFKLVRVKNKLDQKDNNVLINFLFRGKVQCQLQLSTQKVEGNQQKYYAFSHFLYQLSRGSFGILSECAIIISQHDPIAASPSYYDAKKFIEKKPAIHQAPQTQNGKDKSSNIFICIKCSRLIMNQNKHIFAKKKETENVCNQCFINFFNNKDFKALDIKQDNSNMYIEKFLSNPQLSQWMTELIENVQTRKLSHYGQLGTFKSSTLLFSINQKYNQIDYQLLIYEQTDFDWYVIHINDAILLSSQEIRDEDFQIKKISAKIKEKVVLKDLTYIETTLNFINMADLIKANKKINVDIDIVNKLYQIQEKARIVIASNDIEGILKNKNETITFNQNELKLQMMNDLASSANNINHIQYIFAENLKLQAVPQWVSRTDKLKFINLNNNQIQNLALLQDKHELKQLYAQANIISQINCSKLRKLQKLDLSSNRIQKFCEIQLPNLVELNLRVNEISQINLSHFLSIKNLNLASNQLNQLSITNIPPNLQKLVLSSNYLARIMNFPSTLKQLSLNYNQLTEIQNQKLPRSLVHLDISSNYIQKLKIQDMPALMFFYSSSNPDLKEIAIKNVPKLKKLVLQTCNVQSIENIQFPQDIQHIFLSNNSIKRVMLKNIKCIQHLNLTQNSVQQVELKNTNIKILTLIGNGLTTLEKVTIPKTVQRLFLKENKLTQVTLQDYPQISILNLQSNQLTSLKIGHMPKLTELALDFNCFTNIDNINIPSQIQRLFVRGNQLTHLNISDLFELHTCVLDRNPLAKLSMKRMPKLAEVGLMYTQIKSQADMDVPNTVKKIFLHYNQLQQVTYSHMPNLQLIVLQGNCLKQAKLQNLPNLSQVYFNENSLTNLTLKKLPKLTQFVAPNNSLTELFLKEMPFLKKIVVNSNKLTELKLQQVSLIQNFNISDNKLKELKLKNLPALKNIYVSVNEIEVFQLYNLPFLVHLDLYGNSIKKAKFNKLKSLKILTLNQNPIQVLEIDELKNLQQISMQGVKMKEWHVKNLPKLDDVSILFSEIQTLTFENTEKMHSLNLSQNKLKYINFNDLPKLNSINVYENLFTTLSLINMQEMQQINFDNNHLSSIQLINLPKLTKINANNNKIETVTLKNLPQLIYLHMDDNSLQQLDLSTCGQPTQIYISNNRFTDFSGIKMKTDKLRTLSANSIDITSIQIKEYSELQNVYLSQCKNLKEAQFQGCSSLGTITCKSNPVLQKISIRQMATLIAVNISQQTFTNCQIFNVSPESTIYVSNNQLKALIRNQNQQNIKVDIVSKVEDNYQDLNL